MNIPVRLKDGEEPPEGFIRIDDTSSPLQRFWPPEKSYVDGILRPNKQQLRMTFISNGVPFIAFGFLVSR